METPTSILPSIGCQGDLSILILFIFSYRYYRRLEKPLYCCSERTNGRTYQS